MDHEPWHFMAVYFDAIDHYSHGFMKFHPPRRPHIPEDLYDRWHGVVEGGYRFHDMMLGQLIRQAGPDTTILLCSDHGFHSDHLRPTGLPDEPAGPAAEHRHHGILGMAGPGVAKDSLFYGATLLDVCPTVLTLFGLPVGRDMDGKPLVQALDRPVEPEVIDSWDEIEGDAGMLPEPARRDPWAEQEALNQLIALGYVDPPDKDAAKAVANCERETDYYLARVLVHKGDLDGARPLLEKLHRKHPDQSRFGLRLANPYLQQEHADEARGVVDEVFAAQEAIAKDHENEKERDKARRKLERSGPRRELLYAQIALAGGDAEQAQEHLERVQIASPRYPGLANELGRTYSRLRRWQDAEEAFFQALEADPHSPAAYQGLGMIYLAQRHFRDAAEALGESVGLIFHNPAAHFHLGEALFRLGDFEEAERRWLTCAEQVPGLRRVHQRLVELYHRYLNDPVKATERQRFIDEHLVDGPEAAAGESLEVKIAAQNTGAPVDPATQRAPEADTAAAPAPLAETVIVVSGLPRAGTSMMMQMLAAGGIEVLSDDARGADESNPKGYLEYAPVKGLVRDAGWVEQARSRAVKVIAQLLPYLPREHHYKVIFMERDLDEVLDSQQGMLERLGAEGGDRETLAEPYRRQLELVHPQLARRGEVEVLRVPYRGVVEAPADQARRVADFLAVGKAGDEPALAVEKAAAAVDRALYRQRAAPMTNGDEQAQSSQPRTAPV